STRAVSLTVSLWPMRAGRAEVGDVCALVVGGDLERAARAGRVLLEDQRDLLAGQTLVLAAVLLVGLQLRGQVEEVDDLVRRVIVEVEEVATAEVDDGAHLGELLSGITGDRTGHAVAAAATAAKLLARDRVHLDAGLGELRVGRLVALVGDDGPGPQRDDVVAVVPLVPF